jgi:lysozyme
MGNKILICLGLGLSTLFMSIFNLVDLYPSSKSDFKISGIDISHHNRIYDWDKVSEKNKFCIMKATEGSSFKDPKFKNYWQNSKKHGMTRGAYHFFKPGVSAAKQFANFKNRVTLVSGDLPPILDVELKNSNINEVNKWLKLAENYYGVKPIVYSDFVFFKIYMEEKLDDYPLWLHVNYRLKVKPSFNNFDCVFWQYNQKGRIDGVSGEIDLNNFLGSSKNFNNLLIK